MSRLFEALQRSESENSGNPFTWPHVKVLNSEQLNGVPGIELEHCPSLLIAPTPESRLVGLTTKDSLGAEKFRFLAVRLRQISQSHPIKKVLITSTIAEEGKSLVSANLAIAFAHRHVQKILLVEGDLRRPVLAQQFGLGSLPGLCEWLQGDGPSAFPVYHLKNAGFWFLPAGTAPENPLELMQSARLAQLIDQLTSIFDWIVIDSPPVLPLGDTSVWARLIDGIVLVVREAHSRSGQIKDGMQALHARNLLGIVLNGCREVDRGNYYQRYYSPLAKSHAPTTSTT